VLFERLGGFPSWRLDGLRWNRRSAFGFAGSMVMRCKLLKILSPRCFTPLHFAVLGVTALNGQLSLLSLSLFLSPKMYLGQKQVFRIASSASLHTFFNIIFHSYFILYLLLMARATHSIRTMFHLGSNRKPNLKS
jgi:hypothetical protein